ncbi:restriction endonuclease [Kitasatospora sp. NPDC058478]|uniref:restriction endonuclease n=1 Tax=unclassified Kitasatospora TaxID=2633591 RepID=UPI00364D4483
MIIDCEAPVTPPNYEDETLRWEMGNYIAEAGPDELFASYLWARECKIARAIHLGLSKHRDAVKAELDRIQPRLYGGRKTAPLWTPTRDDCVKAAVNAHNKLYFEHKEAEAKEQEAWDIWITLLDDSGQMKKLLTRYGRIAERGPFLLDTAAKLWHDLPEARGRMEEILRAYRDELHPIALRDAARIAFEESAKSISMDRLHGMHHKEFELAVAGLAERDGFQVRRDRGGAGDLGADVIALTPDQKRVVIQCKHVKDQRTKVGSPALQTLNGTARPVHQADVVAVVTNGSYSEPARDFARTQNIVLIDWVTMRDWATWGQPLSEVLGIGEPRGAAAAA